VPDYPFQVALSFAGEQREYVRAVAGQLARRGVKHFYDEDQMAELWGRDLNEALQEIYRDRARFVVMFVSAAYASKAWPTRERRAAFEGAVSSMEDRVLPVRFDATDIPGLGRSVSYVQAERTTPDELAELLCRKLVLTGESIRPQPSHAVPRTRPVGARLMTVAVRDDHGEPLEGVMVVLASKHGRYWQTTTGADGVARLHMTERGHVSVFTGLLNHTAGLVPVHDSGLDVDVVMPWGDGWSSAVIQGTGYLEGFPHRLNPKGDSHRPDGTPGRTYLYVDGASVNDSPGQPYQFSIGQQLSLDDGVRHQVEARNLAFVGQCSLWEYVHRSAPLPLQDPEGSP